MIVLTFWLCWTICPASEKIHTWVKRTRLVETALSDSSASTSMDSTSTEGCPRNVEACNLCNGVLYFCIFTYCTFIVRDGKYPDIFKNIENIGYFRYFRYISDIFVIFILQHWIGWCQLKGMCLSCIFQNGATKNNNNSNTWFCFFLVVFLSWSLRFLLRPR